MSDPAAQAPLPDFPRGRHVLAAANGPLGATLLDVLARHRVELVGVLVGPARTGRRDPCPFVTAWARRHDAPAIHVPSWRAPDAVAALDGVEYDVLLSLAYDLILPKEALERARRLAVNLHRGIAPDFRGCYSTAWALEHGSSRVGATLHVMTPEVDAGPILAQREIVADEELTAAELTPRVEQLAVELLDESVDVLLGDGLVPRPQSGGRTFPHRLPAHELDTATLPGVAERIRALHHPPHPPVQLRLGERRFAIVEMDPRPPLEQIAGEAEVQAFSSYAGAMHHALTTAGAPVVLPSCGAAELYVAAEASGLGLRFYDLDEQFAPRSETLVAALSPGASVVLPMPFGLPCDASALALARAAGCAVIEDRSAAVLDSFPLAGDLAVVALRPWLGVPDGALLLSRSPLPEPAWEPPDLASIGRRLAGAAAAVEGDRWGSPLTAHDDGEGDAAPRAISRWTLAAIEREVDLAAARAGADSQALDLMAGLGAHAAATHWPLGAHAHGFPVWSHDPEAAIAVLAVLGVRAVRPWAAWTARGEEIASRLVSILDGRAADHATLAQALAVPTGAAGAPI